MVYNGNAQHLAAVHWNSENIWPFLCPYYDHVKSYGTLDVCLMWEFSKILSSVIKVFSHSKSLNSLTCNLHWSWNFFCANTAIEERCSLANTSIHSFDFLSFKACSSLSNTQIKYKLYGVRIDIVLVCMFDWNSGLIMG